MVSTIVAIIAILIGAGFMIVYGGASIAYGAPDHIIGRVLLIGAVPVAIGIAILVWG